MDDEDDIMSRLHRMMSGGGSPPDHARFHEHMMMMMRGGMGGGGGGRGRMRQQMQSILERIGNAGDDSEQFAGLSDFCNELNMATEETLSAIRPDEFVPALVTCLQKEYNPEVMLIAARGLTYLLDAVPAAVGVVATSDEAIGAILHHLRVISDVELAEQCITCVEKVVAGSPEAIIRKGGIPALIGYVDFFNIAVQRRAWATVARLCSRLRGDGFSFVEEALPMIHNATGHDDPKIVESAIISLQRMINAMQRDGGKVRRIFGDVGLHVVDVISKGSMDTVFNAAVQLVAVASGTCPDIARDLLEIGLVHHIVHLLQRATVSRVPSSSDGASPIRNDGGLPPSLTPPRTSSMGRDASSGRQGGAASSSAGGGSSSAAVPSPQLIKELCSTLTSLLPKVRDGALQYLSPLITLHNAGAFQHHHQPHHEDDGPRRAVLASMARRASRRHRRGDDDDESGANGNGDDDDVPDPEGDNGEEDDEDDDEKEDEGEEESDNEELSLEALQELATAGLVHLEKADRHSQCRNGAHSCDLCGAMRLQTGNWFRCNVCADFDACLACMIKRRGMHGPSSAAPTPHTFTDMSDVFDADAPAMGTTGGQNALARKLAAEAAGPSSPNVCARMRNFAEAPYLLQRVIEALPVIVRLKLDSDHPKVHLYCALFIARAIYHGPDADLRRVLADAPLCEAIVSGLRSADKHEIPIKVVLLFIAQQLMVKLPDIYGALLPREGITGALLELKASSTQRELDRAANAPMEQLASSAEGWRTMLARDAASLLHAFPSLSDVSRDAAWTSACALLRDKRSLRDGFRTINELICDASAFEVMNSPLFHDLRLAFQTAEQPVLAVVDFIYALSAGCTAAESSAGLAENALSPVSNLTKFIRLLQSALSQLESFKQPSISANSGNMRVHMAPHDPQKYQQELAEAAAKRLTRSKRGSQPSSPASPSPPTSTMAVTPATEGRSATANIEPLASLHGVVEFIRNNLLEGTSGGGRRDRSGEDGAGEEEAEEVLPDGAAPPSGSAAAAPSSSTKATTTRVGQSLYLRVGRYCVPSSLTMLQLVQRFGTAASSKGNSRDPVLESLRRRGAEIPPEIHQMLLARHSSGEPVTVHYSTVPFGSDVLPYDQAALSSTATGASAKAIQYSPAEPVRYIPIGEAVITEGCTNIRDAIYAKFEFSHHHLSSALQNVLSLLGVLYNAVVFWDCITLWLSLVPNRVANQVEQAPTTSLQEFVNVKLNNKAMRHCANTLLAGQHLNTWAVPLALDCNFLFTSSTRRFLFDVSFCGTARSLVRMQEYFAEAAARGAPLDREQSMGSGSRQHRLHRQKKRVWREKALECAMIVMDGRPGTGNAVLEFEFYGEEGSGLGPTLEFYTIVGESLRERRHRLWRASDEADGDTHFNAPNGLFPRALPSAHPDTDSLRKYFRFVGRYLARSLLDRRIPNLRLSRAFIKMLRGDLVSFDQLQCINPELFTVLRRLLQSACLGEGCTTVTPAASDYVESLGLTFVLPGVDDLELIPNGAATLVTSQNALQYINLVAEFLLKRGVDHFIMEMRAGFHELVPLYSLRIMTVDEIQEMLDGHTGALTMEDLELHAAANHGYTMHSQPVKWLFEVLTEMDVAAQRRFLQFLTGSPFLPVGGLANLRPKLTIVRKTSTDPKLLEADQLPSAMTCQNYLKLPQYDSKEKLHQKLKQAIEEGCGVFLFT